MSVIPTGSDTGQYLFINQIDMATHFKTRWHTIPPFLKLSEVQKFHPQLPNSTEAADKATSVTQD